MIAEIYGLPASGKTTTARALHASSSVQVVKAHGVRQLLKLNVLFFLHFPIFSLITVYYLIKESYSFKIWKYKFLNLFLHVNARYMLARRETKAVIDQGHWHSILAIFENKLPEKRLLYYVGRIPPIDHVAVFEAPHEVRRERLARRGYGVRTQFPKKRVEAWLQVMEHNDQLIRKVLVSHNIPHTIIKGDATTQQMVDQLEQLV